MTKQRDAGTGQQSLLFQIDYPEIGDGIVPRHRFMSAYEQHVEPPDKRWQYLLFAAEPYETISFKVFFFVIQNKKDCKFFSFFRSRVEKLIKMMINFGHCGTKIRNNSFCNSHLKSKDKWAVLVNRVWEEFQCRPIFSKISKFFIEIYKNLTPSTLIIYLFDFFSFPSCVQT